MVKALFCSRYICWTGVYLLFSVSLALAGLLRIPDLKLFESVTLSNFFHSISSAWLFFVLILPSIFLGEVLHASVRDGFKPNESSDPLDDLLKEKGINPEKLMQDIQYQRELEGDENAMNRAWERVEIQRRRSETRVKTNRQIGGF